MRLSLYEHLQRLSPRFYARTRLGDIVSRLNNDISEIQRVAAEAALAWVGNVLFLAGSLVMMVWLDWRLAIIALAPMPISWPRWPSTAAGSKAASPSCASGAPTSAAS